eukprot:TRINITY_DN5140_c0_g1_i1.p1 TRINITY_DN5140_c0_g1~~TRINITY_DN5140_c0_g1_i1.p1  ORF type:complete len:294 (+),score=34.26 TRINITY_DN5140_c0_g1_i1:58-939(+)
MFDCQIADYRKLKYITDVIKELTNEVSIDVEDHGLQIRSMDSSRVCLITLFLKSTGFTSFRVDKNLSIGINLSNLAKVLKFGQSGDRCSLKAEDNASTLQILLEAQTSVRLQRFELKLQELEPDVGEIQDYEYSTVVQLSSKVLEKTLRDLSSVCDSVVISVNESFISFQGSGDVGTASVMIRSQEIEAEDTAVIDCKEPMQDEFALKYLCIFSHAAQLSDKVTLKLSSGLPIQVTFNINVQRDTEEEADTQAEDEDSKKAKKEAGQNWGELRFVLAPKLQDTDQMMDDTQMM